MQRKKKGFIVVAIVFALLALAAPPAGAVPVAVDPFVSLVELFDDLVEWLVGADDARSAPAPEPVAPDAQESGCGGAEECGDIGGALDPDG